MSLLYRKVHGRSPDWIEPFRRFIEEEGGGQIPEVFDGDAPHRQGGRMAQAWSVAELLRCLPGASGGATDDRRRRVNPERRLRAAHGQEQRR